MSFQAEHIIFPHTLVAAATLSAGDPVQADGTKATGPANFVGIAMSDGVSGEVLPVVSMGVVSVQADSSSSGVAVGDRIGYATDGYDTAGVTGGFGFALDAAAASGYFRMLVIGQQFPGAAGAALTAEDSATVDATYGSEESGVINNIRTRVGELEARLQAAGIIS